MKSLHWFAVAILIPAALISIAVAAAQVAETLQIEHLESRYPLALCNDFSSAVYYKQSEVPKSDDWIIFFEGGGGCSSLQECNKRWNQTTVTIDGRSAANPHMSSDAYPSTVTGRDLLSNDPEENPLFFNYTHVLVPYCSQDAFLANRTNPKRSNFRDGFNATEGADNFVYRGREIFYSVFDDLLVRRGMRNAKKIVLAGSSAGGIGILNHLEWIQNKLNETIQGQPPELFLIIDSSWFITFNGNHAVNFIEDIPKLFDLPAPACHDVSLGFSCCTSPACLFTQGYLPDNLPPIFAVSSLYDIFTLDAPLKDALVKYGYTDDQALLRIFNSYGSIMNTTFIQSYSSASPHLSLFTPSCTQHVYLATSNLWDGGEVLNMTVNGEFRSDSGLFTLTHPIQSGHWNQVKINRSGSQTSLHEALQEWYTDPTTPRFFASTCSGPVCGQCLSRISIQPVHDIWVWEVNITILVLSALMTLVPLSIKLCGYLYMKYMLYCQRLYAYKIKMGAARNKPHFPRVTYPVSVSCVELNYKIDHINTQKSGEEQNLLPEQTPDIPSGQYGLYAFVEVFLPFFKKCYQRCTSRINPQGYDNLNSSCGSSDLAGRFRPDSGISSSANGGMAATPISMSYDSLATIDSEDNILGTGHSPSRGIEEAGVMANGGRQRTVLSHHSSRSHRRKKTILNHINMYVNPGELVAIMGPSGSGKTTLLDVLLGRRTAGEKGGEIFINGLPLSKMREWFVVNTGYVRQLATSFYNELTVRENLLFSMNMQAQRKESLSTKLKRVEQVIREMGLEEQADIVVGDGIGLGLSGGQRKRLAIAVQLLSMPSILFLDEPTSGLDSASSLEILKSLQEMAGTGRAVVVTIHQPRSEIFHAFDKILLLCKGQVAFFGSPVKVWEFFRKALIMEKELEEDAIQVQDLVLDLLKEKQSQKQVLRSYKDSQEPLKVKNAVIDGKEDTDHPSPPAYSRYPGFWHRFVSLEARASLRQNLFTIIYLPIVYTVFGLILGTTYLFTNDALQIMSVTCLLSCSSSLFMSSIIMSLLIEPLKLFALEHSDGIANPHELILQVFIRMSAVCTFPLSVCGTLVFALVYQNYSPDIYFLVLLAFLLVNQVWISIFIVLTVLVPSQAHRLCPVFAAIGGFCCGFIVPKPLMPIYYQWIFYINPSFYAYSATTVTILEGTDLECRRESTLECFRESGLAILQRFGISDVNPIQNLVVLIGMVFVCVSLAIIILYLKANFSVIKESLAETFCIAARRRKKAKVGAVVEDAVEAVDSDPAILRSFRVKNGHVVSVPMRRRSQQEQQAMLSGSEGFLDQGRHEVFHDFMRPTDHERESRYQSAEEDQPDNGGIGIRGSGSVHFNLPSSRLSSAEHSDVHTPGATSEAVEVINMEEEEDEERRRLQANKKWNERRRQIEVEFQRLRHFSIQQQRAGRMRHSVSFGDDLEIQVACGTEFVRTGSNGTKTRNFSTTTSGAESGVRTTGAPFMINRNSVPVMHQLERSHSMPVHYPDKDVLAQHQPKLETYAEEDEEEDDDVFDDNILMGLPPKDIPCRTISSSNSTEQLNMDEIPYVDVHDQNKPSPSASGRQHSHQGYVSSSAARRGSKGQDQVPVPVYIRQVAATEHGYVQDGSSRRGSKGRRSQVRQELAQRYQEDLQPQCASREEGQRQNSQGSTRKGDVSHESFV